MFEIYQNYFIFVTFCVFEATVDLVVDQVIDIPYKNYCFFFVIIN